MGFLPGNSMTRSRMVSLVSLGHEAVHQGLLGSSPQRAKGQGGK